MSIRKPKTKRRTVGVRAAEAKPVEKQDAREQRAVQFRSRCGTYACLIADDDARDGMLTLTMRMDNGNAVEPIIVAVGALSGYDDAIGLADRIGQLLSFHGVSAKL